MRNASILCVDRTANPEADYVRIAEVRRKGGRAQWAIQNSDHEGSRQVPDLANEDNHILKQAVQSTEFKSGRGLLRPLN
jgi:hypothetical protein